jgi:hypothetical protein
MMIVPELESRIISQIEKPLLLGVDQVKQHIPAARREYPIPSEHALQPLVRGFRVLGFRVLGFRPVACLTI